MSRRVRDDSLFDLRTGYWNGDLLAIFDETAGGVIEELDFRREAQNAKTFGESIAWLGYARVPETLPELTTRRALAMEWIEGRHLQDLKPEEAARMTYMAVEAVTAGLCLTGLVHADPHEGTNAVRKSTNASRRWRKGRANAP